MELYYILCNCDGETHCVAGPLDKDYAEKVRLIFLSRFPFLSLYISNSLPDGVSIPYMDKK